MRTRYGAPVARDSNGVVAARVSMWMLLGVPAGIAWSATWAVWVDTSPTVADADRIRGWGTVVRELPGTLPLIAVPFAGMALAVLAGRAGSLERARQAIWFHGAALFLVLLVVMNGSTENIMTTRPSTVKWLLLPLQVAITGSAVWVSRRWAESGRRTAWGA